MKQIPHGEVCSLSPHIMLLNHEIFLLANLRTVFSNLALGYSYVQLFNFCLSRLV